VGCALRSKIHTAEPQSETVGSIERALEQPTGRFHPRRGGVQYRKSAELPEEPRVRDHSLPFIVAAFLALPLQCVAITAFAAQQI
jgi:hypothetical protein